MLDNTLIDNTHACTLTVTVWRQNLLSLAQLRHQSIISLASDDRVYSCWHSYDVRVYQLTYLRRQCPLIGTETLAHIWRQRVLLLTQACRQRVLSLAVMTSECTLICTVMTSECTLIDTCMTSKCTLTDTGMTSAYMLISWYSYGIS